MSNNTLTINKLKALFEDVAIRHKMVNDFGFGPSYNIGTERPLLYPYIWVEPTNTRIQIVNGMSGPVEFYTFNLYVMDKINKGDQNYIETSSDCDYITKTIMVELEQHIYYQDLDLSFEGDVSSEPVYEQTEDNANGWMMTFTLKLPLRYTPCNIPMEPILGYTVSLATDITEYRLIGATGPQGPAGPTGPQGIPGATGVGGTQSLQDVTDIGSTTSNTIEVIRTGFGGHLTMNNPDENGYVGIDFLNDTGLVGQFISTGSTFSNQAFKPNTTSFANYGDGVSLIAGNTNAVIEFYTGGYATSDLRLLFNNDGIVMNNDSIKYIKSLYGNQNIAFGDDNILLIQNRNALDTERAKTEYITNGILHTVLGNNLTESSTIVHLYDQININTVYHNINTTGYFSSYCELGGLWSNIYHDNAGNITIAINNADINFYNGGAYTIPGNGTNNVIVVNDTQCNKGLVYNDDYSANFTPESLVSKRYVDSRISSATASLQSQITSNTTSINSLSASVASNTSAISAINATFSNYVTLTGTQTLSNKTIVKRVVTTTQSATPSINTNDGDIFSITGLASNVTSFTTNLSGTPVHGQMISIEITDNGVARTLTWGSSFSNSGSLSLPTTTVISTLLRCLFQWNSATSKFEIVAVV